YDNQIPAWINFIAQKSGLAIEPDAIALLHQFVGSNLADIQSELQKLAQYIQPRVQIGVRDVIEVVSKIKVQSVFDLSRAIGENDKAKALLCLSQLLAHGPQLTTPGLRTANPLYNQSAKRQAIKVIAKDV